MTVYVQAIHTVRPLRRDYFDRWVEWYANEALPRMASHGFEVVGAWKRSTGRGNQDLLLTRFESLAAYEKASAAMFGDREFGRGIGGLFREGIQIEEEITIGNPVPYSDEARLEAAMAERPPAPRQYLQTHLPVTLGRSPKAYQIIAELAPRIEAAGIRRLVLAYEAASGLRGVLNGFWVFPGATTDLSYQPANGPNDLVNALREIAPDEEFTYLNPLPFSPLQ
jgi:hypothetical protein